MSNMNSVFNKFSRYVGGGQTEVANNRLEWHERDTFVPDSSDVAYTVENFYEGRLDLISAAFYDEPRFWWLIAQYNRIIDPIGEVKAGTILQIPSKDRLQIMLNTKQGGYESSKQPVNTISPVII